MKLEFSGRTIYDAWNELRSKIPVESDVVIDGIDIDGTTILSVEAYGDAMVEAEDVDRDMGYLVEDFAVTPTEVWVRDDRGTRCVIRVLRRTEVSGHIIENYEEM